MPMELTDEEQLARAIAVPRNEVAIHVATPAAAPHVAVPAGAAPASSSSGSSVVAPLPASAPDIGANAMRETAVPCVAPPPTSSVSTSTVAKAAPAESPDDTQLSYLEANIHIRGYIRDILCVAYWMCNSAYWMCNNPTGCAI